MAIKIITEPDNLIACELAWSRNGTGWALRHNRRRMGQVVPDDEHAGMWRSVKPRGRLSDMANLSWAKNAVLVAAARELEWEFGHQTAIDTTKCPQNRGVLPQYAPPIDLNDGPVEWIPPTASSSVTPVSSSAM